MSKIFKSLIDATNPAIKLSDFASKKAAPARNKPIDLVSVEKSAPKDEVKVVKPQGRDLVAESRAAFRKVSKFWG